MSINTKKLKFNGISLQNNNSNQVGFSAILFGVYTAIIPINPIMNLTGAGTINKYLGMIVIGLIVVSMLLKKQKFAFKRGYNTILLFIIISLISYFYAMNQIVVIASITSLISLVIFYVVCTNKSYSNSEKNYIKLCSIFGSLVVSFYLISIRDLFYNRVRIITSDGQWADPNGLSASIALGIIILISYLFETKNKTKIILIVGCMIIMLYAMLLTGSRGGLMGLVAGVSIYIVFGTIREKITKKRMFIYFIALIFIVTLILNTGILSKYINMEVLNRLKISSAIETGGSGRLTIFKNSLQVFYKRPLTGYGFGTAPYVLQKYYGTYTGTHNDILYLALGTGVVGLILFISFLINTIKITLIRNDTLTLSLIVMVLVLGLSLDYMLNKNFWNVMIYSHIGLGVTNSTPNQTKMIPKGSGG